MSTTDDTARGVHLTITQVARLAAASVTAVARMVREGRITARRDPTDGVTWRIPRDEVAKVIALRAEWRDSGKGVANRRIAPVIGELDWQDRGKCQDRPDLYMGPYAESSARKRRREASAVAICATCPVMQTCRSYALAGSERYGVWGGLTQEALRTAVKLRYKQVAA